MTIVGLLRDLPKIALRFEEIGTIVCACARNFYFLFFLAGKAPTRGLALGGRGDISFRIEVQTVYRKG